MPIRPRPWLRRVLRAPSLLTAHYEVARMFMGRRDALRTSLAVTLQALRR